LDFSLNVINASLEHLEISLPDETVSSILPGIQLVHDTAEWWYTGPNAGFRGAISLTTSPKYSKNSLQFTTVKTDVRKYLKLSRNYSFAFRFAGGVSAGRNPQQFFLGGVSNWLNRKWAGGLRIESIKDVYFSEFVTPLRGARYYERVGSKFALVNSEFRFPLIPYLELGFPPIRLGNIQGLFFTDIGSAWNSNKGFVSFRKDLEGNRYFNDLVMGYGVGARIFFLFLIKYDIAWEYDLRSSSKPKHYISLGIDF